jgi:hypothetical protein
MIHLCHGGTPTKLPTGTLQMVRVFEDCPVRTKR